MEEDYLLVNYKQMIYRHYERCCQGERKVAEYVEDFHRLGAVLIPPDKIARLIDGSNS